MHPRATTQPRSIVNTPLALVIIFLLGMLVLPPAYGQSEGQRINKVEIQGLTTYTPEQIQRRLKSKVGQPYSAVDVRQDLTELGKIMRTAVVQTDPDGSQGITVRYIVSEFPRFRKLQVIGNQRLSTARIETIAALKKGDVLDERTQRSLAKALRKEYKVSGMPQAHVTLNVIEVPAGADGKPKPAEADLQVVVDEGRQVLVQSVTLKGNHDFTTLRLKTHIETKGSWSFIKNYYDEETYTDDLDRLRDFYAANGYFDAKIERGLFTEQAAGGKTVVSPVIQISEGTRYRFGEAHLRGVRLFGQTEALEPFTPLKGKLFDGKDFGDAMEKLKSLYMNHGLLTTEINPQFDYDVKNKVLNVTIDVVEKDRIYVGKVKLVPRVEDTEKKSWFGRWYTHVSPPVTEKTILREVLLNPGDVYNKKLENDSIRRLARLGVFDNDKLKAYNEPTGTPGVHNLVIDAPEAMTGALSGGVGYGDVTGAFVFASLSERNVFGEANVFNTQVLLGMRDASVSTSYLDRHLRDTDNSLFTRLFYDKMYLPGYIANTAGLHSEVGHPLANDWTVYLRGRLEAVQLGHRSGFDPKEDVEQSYPVATARLRFEQDTRYPVGNHPREGYLQSYGVEAGYAGAAMVKFEGSRDQYWPVTEKLTYRLNAAAGMMPFDASTVPIQERYFLGGDSDLRGFAYRGAGYHDSKDKDVPTGGAAKLIAKNELHYPIYEPISGVIFADVGAVGKSPVSWQVPRASTGTGLRFDLKSVQVAVDLALPILYQTDDETRYFHFSMKSAF